MRVFVFAVLASLSVADRALAALPFFAPPAPAGSLVVTLQPVEGVAPGTPKLVTLGLPLPRGSLTAAQLSTVRVLHDGVEVAAYVDELTPWRHRANASLDGTSVRVARIQFEHAFDAAYPANESVVVAWGGSPRLSTRPALVDPRSSWHQVTTGSFVAADNVWEPDVYALLPPTWLTQGLLKPSRSTPFDASNPPTRDDPAANAAIAHWPGFTEAERAHKNNFYTMINRDDPNVSAANQIRFRTDAEPWLYDRAATMFILYLRNGSFVALREAVQNAQFYAGRVNAAGIFTLSSNDMKYSYNESLAYAYWLTADTTLLPDIAAAAQAYDGFSHAWSPNLGFWTERHAALKLLARSVAYEVLGGTTRATAVTTMLAALATHQDGANGQLPAQRIDGGLYHTGTQHGDWGSALGASSWMTALLSDAAVRAYATDERASTAQFVRRLGNFLRATIVRTTDHQYDSVERPAPLYAMTFDGADATPDFGPEEEHALNVAAQIAWAHYFSAVLGEPDAILRQSVLDLYATYDRGVNFWIRPAAPASGLAAFRVNPPRKWGWEHRTSDGLAFAMTEASDSIFAADFE